MSSTSLAEHYLLVTNQLGIDQVGVHNNVMFFVIDGRVFSLFLYPADPGYLRLLTYVLAPAEVHDLQDIAAAITRDRKMVKANIDDKDIVLVVETLADPACGSDLPDVERAAAALDRALSYLWSACESVSDSLVLSGIAAATETSGAARGAADCYVPCPVRGTHQTLVECWMCWCDVHAGRVPAAVVLAPAQGGAADSGQAGPGQSLLC